MHDLSTKPRRKYITLLIAALIIVAYFVVMFQMNLKQELNTLCNQLPHAINAQMQAVSRLNKLKSSYLSMNEHSSQNMFKLVIFQYGDSVITEDELAEMNADEVDQNTYYYINSNGDVISAPNDNSFALNEDQIAELKQDKKLQLGHKQYFCEKVGDGYIIATTSLKDTTVSMLETIENEESSPYPYFIYDSATHDILEISSNNENTDLLNQEGNTDNLFWKSGADLSNQMNVGDDNVVQWSFDNNWSIFSKNLFVGIERDLGDGTEVCMYFPMSTAISEVLAERSLPLLMLVMFAIFSVAVGQRFYEDWKLGKLKGKTVTVFKRFHINTSINANIVFVMFCVGLLTLVASIGLRSLWRFTTLYDEGMNNLSEITDSLDKKDMITDNLQSRFEEQLLTEAKICSSFFDKVKSGEIDKDPEEYLDEMKNLIGAKQISVYDKNGEIIYTTNEYVGYSLTQIEDDNEYKMWHLINGEKDEVVYEGEESGTYYAGVRRTDNIGLIMIEQPDTAIRPVLEVMDYETVLRLSGVVNSDIMYADQNSPDTLYVLSSADEGLQTVKNTLPTPGNLEEYSGLERFLGSMCFICAAGNEDSILYNSNSISRVVDFVGPTFLSMVIVEVLLCILVVCMTAVPTEEEVLSSDGNDLYTKEALGTRRRKVMLQGMRLVLIVAVFMMIVDCVCSTTSVPYFLFTCNWNKGFNIFAISVIVITLIFVVVGLKLLNKFFKALGSGLPSRTSTILQMANSVLNAIVIVWFIVFSLREFGIDMTTILAGLGLTGFAIGLGAQGTISDLVAGLFIIIDGHIHVGDYIRVDGFYGEVIHMGIRTTKIKSGNEEISIHNSDMNDVVNCTLGGDSKASVEFAVSFSVKTDDLRALINANQERFQKACNGKLLDEVKLAPVAGFESSDNAEGCNVQYKIGAHVKEADKDGAVAAMREVLKHICEEAGIIITG